MRVQGSADFMAPPERVWDLLLDPGVMQRCIPGCQKLEEVGEDTYDATLRVGIGAISGVYRGRVTIAEKLALERYSMVFEGAGTQGFVQGSGRASLHGENGATRVVYSYEVEVGGLIASVGQRALQGVSSFLVGQMFSRFQKLLENGEGS